jgi:hypothetical protein
MYKEVQQDRGAHIRFLLPKGHQKVQPTVQVAQKPRPKATVQAPGAHQAGANHILRVAALGAVAVIQAGAVAVQTEVVTLVEAVQDRAAAATQAEAAHAHREAATPGEAQAVQVAREVALQAAGAKI